MEVIKEEIIGGKSRTETIKFGKKKFIRIADEKGVKWKRAKTKHEVKFVEFENLEKKYRESFPVNFAPVTLLEKEVWTPVAGPNKGLISYNSSLFKSDKDRVEFEKGIVKYSKNGNYKLGGVKFIKEKMGWGLRESSSFYDSFMERKNKFNS